MLPWSGEISAWSGKISVCSGRIWPRSGRILPMWMHRFTHLSPEIDQTLKHCAWVQVRNTIKGTRRVSPMTILLWCSRQSRMLMFCAFWFAATIESTNSTNTTFLCIVGLYWVTDPQLARSRARCCWLERTRGYFIDFSKYVWSRI